METTTATSAMSASLLARDVYCVCYPRRDGMDLLLGELTAVRKKFFTGNKRPVKAGKADIIKGFDGKLNGKMTRRSLYWKKTAGKLPLEEAFELKSGYVVVRRDFRGVIVSRTFFDRNHLWLKSEYYEPWDSADPQVIFKPKDASDLVERFDRDTQQKRYRSTDLHPLPYQAGTAEQSILTARFGEPELVISTGEGDFCYCPKKEAQARKRALDEMQEGTIVLMPAWEIKDGALAGDQAEESGSVSFTSLEEYAKVEPGQDALPQAPTPSGPPDMQDTEEFDPVTEDAPAQAPLDPEPFAGEPLPAPEPVKAEKSSSDQDFILEAARRVAEILGEPSWEEETPPETAPLAEKSTVPASAEPASAEPASAEPEESDFRETPPLSPAAPAEEPVQQKPAISQRPSYRGAMENGQITGRGRTEQQNGLTAYDGEYRDGRRDGFGSYYYKDGSLCYAGFWKDDKRDGLGVSFREKDHVLHISKWENGQPGSFVSLFGKDGSLRYGGRIENGKKEGAGVSFDPEDGTIFVGQWENGTPTGLGSSFDKNGNLLYYGGWKDGKRSGHGTEFDSSGAIVYDGQWKDGKYHNGILYQKQPREETEEDIPSLPWATEADPPETASEKENG